MSPTSLTEFDHAVSAWFDNLRPDPVQRAWLDRTVYWTVWWGILCDQDCFWSEDMDDEWWSDDDTARCDYQSEADVGDEAAIDAANALWESMGRIWPDRSQFVDSPTHHRLGCDP